MVKNNETSEISLKEIVINTYKAFQYLKKKWIIILICAILGGAAGLLLAMSKKITYTAVSSFVLEDSKGGGGLGQYAGLASIAGIDLGSGGTSGIFQGDNIIELYKSRLMIETALLSPVQIDGKKQLLLDRYVEMNKLREQWKKNDRITSISFAGDPEKFTRKQDSIITGITETFNKQILKIGKQDKKLNIMQVEVTTNDELFSKEFNNKLVETVNNFYTFTKTKKSLQNLLILQKQADSVKNVLNNSINGVASSLDAAPNANPALLSLRVPSQKKQIDVQANTAIYGEIVKNLELSKITLRQEAPLIQMIDKPVLPLKVDRLGKSKGILVGVFLGGFLSVLVISCRKLLSILLQ